MNSEFVGLDNSIKNTGAVPLSVLFNEKLIEMMSYDIFTGAVDGGEINQIYKIMDKKGIYHSNFFEQNNIKDCLNHLLNLIN